MTTRTCVSCKEKTKIRTQRNGSVYGYCPNRDCPRYGLHTLVWDQIIEAGAETDNVEALEASK